MTAQELFRALGYELKILANGNYLYSQPRETQNRHNIEFFIKSKTYHIIGTKRFLINMELHKAIQKQIEELNW